MLTPTPAGAAWPAASHIVQLQFSRWRRRARTSTTAFLNVNAISGPFAPIECNRHSLPHCTTWCTRELGAGLRDHETPPQKR
jgi:hypothetical protein